MALGVRCAHHASVGRVCHARESCEPSRSASCHAKPSTWTRVQRQVDTARARGGNVITGMVKGSQRSGIAVRSRRQSVQTRLDHLLTAVRKWSFRDWEASSLDGGSGPLALGWLPLCVGSRSHRGGVGSPMRGGSGPTREGRLPHRVGGMVPSRRGSLPRRGGDGANTEGS
jgi:hypothetical protein